MKDIVERLREIGTTAMLEAADVIEMLRRENLHACPHCGYQGQPDHPGSNQVKGWMPPR